MAIAKEQIRQIIADNNLNSVADVYTLLKDGFKDILQELMEAELDISLGYEKNQKGARETNNKRNGHPPKTIKSQYGELQVDIPRTGTGNLNPNLSPSTRETFPGSRKKSYHFMPGA